MTTREAVSTIQRILLPAVDEFNKQDAPGFAQMVDEAWKIVREAALKAENRPSDERTTTKGMFIPESPKHEELDSFRHNVELSLTELNKRTMQNETDILMLWDAVTTLKRVWNDERK
jgi:hypothetical protein